MEEYNIVLNDSSEEIEICDSKYEQCRIIVLCRRFSSTVTDFTNIILYNDIIYTEGEYVGRCCEIYVNDKKIKIKYKDRPGRNHIYLPHYVSVSIIPIIGSKNLQDKVNTLEKQMTILLDHLCFQPDSIGEEQAREDFNNLLISHLNE